PPRVGKRRVPAHDRGIPVPEDEVDLGHRAVDSVQIDPRVPQLPEVFLYLLEILPREFVTPPHERRQAEVVQGPIDKVWEAQLQTDPRRLAEIRPAALVSQVQLDPADRPQRAGGDLGVLDAAGNLERALAVRSA